MPIYTQGIEALKADGSERPISNSNEIPAFTFVNMTTGTTGPQAQWLSVQPNPAADYLHIGIQNDLRATRCVLSNMIGQEVAQQTLTEGSNTLDTRNLPAGVYTLRVITERGVVSRQVVISR
jgi:hypothetical protein